MRGMGDSGLLSSEQGPGKTRLQLVGISDRFAYQLIAATASAVSAAWT